MSNIKASKYWYLVIFIIIILIAMGAFFELGESLGKALVKP
jgi:hypothetical protein